MSDLIERQAVIDVIFSEPLYKTGMKKRSAEEVVPAIFEKVKVLPPAQPEYEPVKAEDFARTMSENTLYSFMAWHSEALELMERQGFVICKKRM